MTKRRESVTFAHVMREQVPPPAVPVADPYVRAGVIVDVIDGDTVRVSVDCGFSIYSTQSLRMLGINAAEHGTVDGDAATAWLKRKLPKGKDVIVRTHLDQREKYGRMLGEIFLPAQPISVNQQAINTGHAKPWDGHGTRPTMKD